MGMSGDVAFLQEGGVNPKAYLCIGSLGGTCVHVKTRIFYFEKIKAREHVACRRVNGPVAGCGLRMLRMK